MSAAAKVSARPRRTFLHVERSVLGQRWVQALDERAEAGALRAAQRTGLPEIVCRVLAGRGVAPEAAEGFLAPTLRELMPDPSRLTDMDAAAARMADAILRRERIAVFGDYDVDGAASAALVVRYLRHFGLDTAVHIPDRLREGYGPSVAALRALASAGATLILAVDCGTTSVEALADAAARGVDVVVLDHHQTGAALPPAAAIVNPNRQDDLSGQGMLCAAGVVFLTLAAVSRALRHRGRPAESLPDLMDLLDLVALATVCDVVPLTGVNRAFVARGLAAIRAGGNLGLRALGEVARLGGAAEVYHLGFILGPRINAGGRIGRSDLGARLLATLDAREAGEIADELQLLNEERQGMERRMLAEAEAEVAAEIGPGEGPAVLVAARDTWHPGIVGLIAARLREAHRRPAFAVSFDGEGKGTGSGRSVPGVDLGAAVRGAVEVGLLVKGGGHAMAAGLTLFRDRLGDFRAFVEDFVRRRGAPADASDLGIDAALTARGATVELAATLERAGPFGAGHPQPLFALPRHAVASAGIVGGSHVRCTLRGADGATVAAVAFRAADTALGAKLFEARGQPLHLAGMLGIDRYRGRESPSFRILDAADPA